MAEAQDVQAAPGGGGGGRVIAVCKALYDYTRQNDDELELHEDDLVDILNDSDQDWWRARRASAKGTTEEGRPAGLVPSNFLEEARPSLVLRALYDYHAQAEDELSIAEGEIIYLYHKEDDEWSLVRRKDQNQFGIVPANYVEEATEQESEQAGATASLDPTAEAVTDLERSDDADSAESAPGQSYHVARVVETIKAEEVFPAQSESNPDVRQDLVKTWPVSSVDKKKKKRKGTLGIGNGSVFFASEEDKTPVLQFAIGSMTHYNIDKKHVTMDFGEPRPTSFDFHCGGKEQAEEVYEKIKDSKAIEEELAVSRQPTASSSSSASKPASSRPRGASATAVALYEFTAQGEDELSVREGQVVTVIDDSDAEWWQCSLEGAQGVVPASYLEIVASGKASEQDQPAETSMSAAASHDDGQDLDEDALTRERLKAERERKRRAETEREARRRIQEQERRRREREEKTSDGPPSVSARAMTTSTGSSSQSKRQNSQPSARAQPDRPIKAQSDSKPMPGKCRVWTDRTGTFKVEAEFLGFVDGKIHLHKLNGVKIAVPVERMSDRDLDYMEGRTGQSLSGEKAPKDARSGTKSGAGTSHSVSTANGSTSRTVPRPFDWFDFFLNAGVEVDNATRYASNWERDKMDESVLPDIEPLSMRSLGMKEGDILRVMKVINSRYRGGQPSSVQMQQTDNSVERRLDTQFKTDEDLARKLQAEEQALSAGERKSSLKHARQSANASSSTGTAIRNGAPTPLFTGSDGKLKSNVRTRPQPARQASTLVDAESLLSAGQTLSASNTSRSLSSNGTATGSRVRASSSTSGFGDDAWTVEAKASAPPPASRPAIRSTPQPTPAPSTVDPPMPEASRAPSDPNSTEALIARLQSSKLQREAAAAASASASPSTGSTPFSSQTMNLPPNLQMRNAPGGLNNFASPYPSPGPQAPQQYGSGSMYRPQPQASMRMPPAPIPANQGLLQPLVPAGTNTNFNFIPTRNVSSPQPTTSFQGPAALSNRQPQPNEARYENSGYLPNPPAMQQQYQSLAQPAQLPRQPQQVGQMSSYNNSFQQQSSQQPLQSPGGGYFGASLPPQPPAPPQAAPRGDFDPSNVFASMKAGGGMGNPPGATNHTGLGPQTSDRYDALRHTPMNALMHQQQPVNLGYTSYSNFGPGTPQAPYPTGAGPQAYNGSSTPQTQNGDRLTNGIYAQQQQPQPSPSFYSNPPQAGHLPSNGPRPAYY